MDSLHSKKLLLSDNWAFQIYRLAGPSERKRIRRLEPKCLSPSDNMPQILRHQQQQNSGRCKLLSIIGTQRRSTKNLVSFLLIRNKNSMPFYLGLFSDVFNKMIYSSPTVWIEIFIFFFLRAPSILSHVFYHLSSSVVFFFQPKIGWPHKATGCYSFLSSLFTTYSTTSTTSSLVLSAFLEVGNRPNDLCWKKILAEWSFSITSPAPLSLMADLLALNDGVENFRFCMEESSLRYVIRARLHKSGRTFFPLLLFSTIVFWFYFLPSLARVLADGGIDRWLTGRTVERPDQLVNDMLTSLTKRMGGATRNWQHPERVNKKKDCAT